MGMIQSVFDWFAGNGLYHNLQMCMGNDRFWIITTVTLDLAVATGYGLIAVHWWQNARNLPDSPAKRGLTRLRNIFLFCGVCGYLFIPIKMVWPAWRLYDCFMLVLAYNTWRYAWSAKDLKVVLHGIGKSDQLAQDLADSRAEARRKSYFLNAVSHDLKNPLYGLTLQAELAEVTIASGDIEATREAIGHIKAGARETSEMLNSFLELARIDWNQEPNRVTQFSLNELAQDIIKVYSGPLRRKNLMSSVDAPHEVSVQTDRTKLERILSNLVSNAVKHTESGGVTVRVRTCDQGVRVEVVDTGVGIPQEHHEHLFDEFYQVQNHARDKAKGFGLGLAIAQRLAGQIGTRITVDSRVGEGSRFVLVVPTSIAARNDQSAEGRVLESDRSVVVG